MNKSYKRRRCPKCMRRISKTHYMSHLERCNGTYDKAKEADQG